MNSSFPSPTHAHSQIENPLIWPILEVLKENNNGWKVHVLAGHLNELGYIHQLDVNSEKDLFKRNFLIMNALYQLQETLYPDKWLQVESMNIKLFPQSTDTLQHYSIDINDPLRDYYTNWQNYEATEGEVKRLLNQFWQRYRDYVGKQNATLDMDRSKALSMFKLPADANYTEIRRQWRRLALRWHPDRENGDAAHFRMLCEAWNILRREHSYSE